MEKGNPFSRLSNEVLLNLLKENEPREALTLCKVDWRFGNFCRDPYVFRKLLEAHFRVSIKIDLDSLQPEEYKEYYKSLVNGETSLYHHDFEDLYFSMPREDFYSQCIGFLNRDFNPELFRRDYQIGVLILPGSVPRGAKTWAVVRVAESEAEWEIFAFRSKEEALREAHRIAISNVEALKAQIPEGTEEEFFEFAHVYPYYRDFEKFSEEVDGGMVLYWYASAIANPQSINDVILRVEEIELF